MMYQLLHYGTKGESIGAPDGTAWDPMCGRMSIVDPIIVQSSGLPFVVGDIVKPLMMCPDCAMVQHQCEVNGDTPLQVQAALQKEGWKFVDHLLRMDETKAGQKMVAWPFDGGIVKKSPRKG